MLQDCQEISPKKWYYFEWGKEAGQRMASGIFTFIKPKDQLQKNHNKEALALPETKHSQLILEYQSIGTGFIPAHKYKSNFLDFYSEFVDNIFHQLSIFEKDIL